MSTHTQTPQARASHSQAAVKVTGLGRSFGLGERRVRAVDGIDLVIGRGEIVALLGPNGAGKTTTIDMLLGLSEPDIGEVRVLGRSPREAVARGQLSALLQTGGLLADLTVLETVSVIASFHGAGARLGEVMRRTGLTEIGRRRVGKCSGGEQQRVKFALALLPDPEVLVLDEPTAGMDVNARHRFWETMREEASVGRTIIFATHYLEEAEQFARRTVVMNRGRIVADGGTDELRASLGGRSVAATLPTDRAGAILAELHAQSGEGAAAPKVEIDGERICVRTARSDELAARLLALGAYDLEITAPTLETAFAALTKQ